MPVTAGIFSFGLSSCNDDINEQNPLNSKTYRLSQKCNLDNGALTRGDDDDSSDSDDEERVGDVITGTESRHHKAAKIA